jgi:competence protein ComEA
VPDHEPPLCWLWAATAALALGTALPPRAPEPPRPVRVDGGCRLGSAADGPACACGELGAELRLALGHPLLLNSASAADLERLPEVGPARAAAIAAERRRGGPFASLAELAARVSGVGPAAVERLEPYLIADARDPACAREGYTR